MAVQNRVGIYHCYCDKTRDDSSIEAIYNFTFCSISQPYMGTDCEINKKCS